MVQRAGSIMPRGCVRLEEHEVVSAVADDTGAVRIADEVVSVIAGMAASEVEGIAGMSGGIASGLTERLGIKHLQRGVKVEVGEKEAAIDLYVMVDYGARIPEVAQRVQERVKTAVESMTGLKVVEVNVHIQGVAFPDVDVDGQRVK